MYISCVWVWEANVVVITAHLVQMHSAFRLSSDTVSSSADVGGLLHNGSDSSYTMAAYRGGDDDLPLEHDGPEEHRKVVDRVVTEDYSALSAGSPQVSARRMTDVTMGTTLSLNQSRQQNRDHHDDI